MSTTAHKLKWLGSEEVVTKYALRDGHGTEIDITAIQTQIQNLFGKGRFLSLWNCSTGVADSNPPSSPYTYHTGDYFIVKVSGNRIPYGSSYTTGGTNYEISQNTYGVGDVFYFDGTVWQILAAGSGGNVVDVQCDGVSAVQAGIANITKTKIGLGNVDNTSDATKKSNFAGSIADGNTGFVTGDQVYDALGNKVNTSTKVNGHELSSDVTVTKDDVGLGNVANTGDSDTPVSGGTTKFTTGGAFTELAKKVNVPTSFYQDNFVLFNSSGGIKDSSLGKDMVSVNNVAVVQDATHNLNGTLIPINNLHTTSYSQQQYTGLQLLKNTSDILTENDAKTYMNYMCGSKYVPKYNANICKNSFFLFPDGKLYKPQYDSTLGLVLWYMNQIVLGSGSTTNFYQHSVSLTYQVGTTNHTFTFKFKSPSSTPLSLNNNDSLKELLSVYGYAGGDESIFMPVSFTYSSPGSNNYVYGIVIKWDGTVSNVSSMLVTAVSDTVTTIS